MCMGRGERECLQVYGVCCFLADRDVVLGSIQCWRSKLFCWPQSKECTLNNHILYIKYFWVVRKWVNFVIIVCSLYI